MFKSEKKKRLIEVRIVGSTVNLTSDNWRFILFHIHIWNYTKSPIYLGEIIIKLHSQVKTGYLRFQSI